MSEQKIIIEIIDSINPPKVSIDGVEVNVNSISYQYEAKNDVEIGEHKFNLVNTSIVNNMEQSEGIAFNLNIKLD